MLFNVGSVSNTDNKKKQKMGIENNRGYLKRRARDF
jgi:hypothetical protein